MVTDADELVDSFLAKALVGSVFWDPTINVDHVVRRALYHGIAGCLASLLNNWPTEAADRLRRAATAQAMWEIRHRVVLSSLLEAMAAEGIRVLVLKGSALAYDVYENPAARSRGDSDLLIALEDLHAARVVLTAQGFTHFYDDATADGAVRLQEAWTRQTADDLIHEIDLHWQTINSPFLAHILPFSEGWSRAKPLPRLAYNAFGLPRDRALLLACIHRAQHIVNPYFVDGEAYYSGDRLIWLVDIHLLARALDEKGWDAFETAVLESGLAKVAREAIDATARRLGTSLPSGLMTSLANAPKSTPESLYLLVNRQAGRALNDVFAIPGVKAKMDFLWGRLLPSAVFMRAKFPDRTGEALSMLHLRRIIAFLKPRPRGKGA